MITSSARISTLHCLATTRHCSSRIASRRCCELYELQWNELVKVTSNVLPELLNAKIGESLGLVLSTHVEAYTQLVKVQGKDCELIIQYLQISTVLAMGNLTRFLKIDTSL